MPESRAGDEVAALIQVGRDREAALRGAARGAHNQPGGTMDPISQLQQVMPAVGSVVGKLGPDDLDTPTPCGSFTVRGVLEHMIGGATMFAAAYRGDEPHTFDGDDVFATFEQAMSELAEAVMAPGAFDQTVAAPFGDVPGETFARFIALDGLVHGWDIARGTGHPYTPGDELVGAVDGFARQTLDPLRDGDTFATATDAPADASPMDRLAAYTGRTV